MQHNQELQDLLAKEEVAEMEADQDLNKVLEVLAEFLEASLEVVLVRVVH
jgi:hypothetical protein